MGFWRGLLPGGSSGGFFRLLSCVVRGGADGLGDPPGVGQHLLLQITVVRRGYVQGVHAVNLVIQEIQSPLINLRHDLRSHRGERPALIDHDAVTGLLHALDDRLDIQRAVGAAVDDLAVDAFLFQCFRGREGEVDGPTRGDDGAVTALLFNIRLAEGDEKFIIVFRGRPTCRGDSGRSRRRRVRRSRAGVRFRGRRRGRHRGWRF